MLIIISLLHTLPTSAGAAIVLAPDTVLSIWVAHCARGLRRQIEKKLSCETRLLYVQSRSPLRLGFRRSEHNVRHKTSTVGEGDGSLQIAEPTSHAVSSLFGYFEPVLGEINPGQ